MMKTREVGDNGVHEDLVVDVLVYRYWDMTTRVEAVVVVERSLCDMNLERNSGQGSYPVEACIAEPYVKRERQRWDPVPKDRRREMWNQHHQHH